MAHQSLDHNEILNVRWATQDPNPAAQSREKRRVEEQAAAAIRAALPAEYVAELEGKDKSAVKKRRIEGTFGLRGYEAPDDVWYASSDKASVDTGSPEQRRIGLGSNDGNAAGTQESNTKGIFSSSALDALRGLQTTGGAKIGANSSGRNAPTGFALDYGSDSD